MTSSAVLSNSQPLNIQSPTTGRRVGTVEVALPDLVYETISKAVAAQPAWAARRTGERADIPTSIGPLISATAAERVGQQVAHAIEQAAKLVYGSVSTQGTFFHPCVFKDVPKSADVAKDDEIFGPVFTCIPFETEDEAVSIANQSSFGLSGCVFSRDWPRALRISDKMECGGIVVNGTGNYRPPFVPFGGVKQSGMDREGLGFTLEEMSQPRYTVLRRIRSAGPAGTR